MPRSGLRPHKEEVINSTGQRQPECYQVPGCFIVDIYQDVIGTALTVIRDIGKYLVDCHDPRVQSRAENDVACIPPYQTEQDSEHEQAHK